MRKPPGCLELAETNDSIAGVVGWVPLSAPGVEADIERFAGHPKLVAFRHVVQDEPDDRYLLRPDFNAGVARLRRFGLAYDILIFEKHLGAAIEFVDRHPSQFSFSIILRSRAFATERCRPGARTFKNWPAVRMCTATLRHRDGSELGDMEAG